MVVGLATNHSRDAFRVVAVVVVVVAGAGAGAAGVAVVAVEDEHEEDFGETYVDYFGYN